MSPTLLVLLRRAERATRRNYWTVRRQIGDDGSRYPRDYFRPADRPFACWMRFS